MTNDAPSFGEDEYKNLIDPTGNLVRPMYDIPFLSMEEMYFFEAHVKPLTTEENLQLDLFNRWTLANNVIHHIESNRQAPPEGIV